MDIIVKNGKIKFKNLSEEETKELTYITHNENGAKYCGINCGYPDSSGTATRELSTSGTYNAYILNVEGLYNQGYRKVVFYANQFGTGSNERAAYAGFVCSGDLPTTTKAGTPTGIEAYIPFGNTPDYTKRLYELPITANSKYVRVNYIGGTSSPEYTQWTSTDFTQTKAVASKRSSITKNTVITVGQ